MNGKFSARDRVKNGMQVVVIISMSKKELAPEAHDRKR